MTDMVMA